MIVMVSVSVLLLCVCERGTTCVCAPIWGVISVTAEGESGCVCMMVDGVHDVGWS